MNGYVAERDNSIGVSAPGARHAHRDREEVRAQGDLGSRPCWRLKIAILHSLTVSPVLPPIVVEMPEIGELSKQ
jgi:hypothetical protein